MLFAHSLPSPSWQGCTVHAGGVLTCACVRCADRLGEKDSVPSFSGGTDVADAASSETSSAVQVARVQCRCSGGQADPWAALLFSCRVGLA